MPAGRPTKCTPELIEKFGDYMAAGLYLQHAAALCEITPRTAENWFNWGEAALQEVDNEIERLEGSKRLYASFFRTVRAREASAIARNLAIMQRAAQDEQPGDWRAAAEFLRMRCPDTFGMRRQRHEVSGAGGGPVEVKHDGLDGAERTREIIGILRDAGVVAEPAAEEADSPEAD